MIIAVISSIVLAILDPNNFLLKVGIFTIYLVGTGDRYMRLRLLGKGQKPAFIDWFLSLGMLLSGICFVGWGSYMIYNSANFGIVLVSFWLIGLNNVRSNFKKLCCPFKKEKVLDAGTYWKNDGWIHSLIVSFYCCQRSILSFWSSFAGYLVRASRTTNSLFYLLEKTL